MADPVLPEKELEEFLRDLRTDQHPGDQRKVIMRIALRAAEVEREQIVDKFYDFARALGGKASR